MSWRLAKSIRTLLDELDAEFPRRSKRSDGTIGDPAHSARVSDHNPNGHGVVTAVDITHDPGDGCDAGELAAHFQALALAGDDRVKYVIWNRRIFNPSISRGWRPYTGSNPHAHHVHLSVSATPRHYDATRGWGIEELNMPTAKEIAEALEPRLVKALKPVIREEVRALLTEEKLVENKHQPWEPEQLPKMTVVGALSNIEKDTDPKPEVSA